MIFIKTTYSICIFDLDGTLINSLDDLADSCNAALQNHGMPTHPVQEYRYLVGSGIKNLIKRSLGDKADNEQLVVSVFNDFNRIYGENCLNKTKPYDGIIELTEKLKSHSIKLCILSNKSDDFTHRIVDTLFPKDTFDIVWGKREQYPIKPSPEALLAMLMQAGEKPDNCLYIGDSDVDVMTARNAQTSFCGVSWGFRCEEELKGAGAKAIAHTPDDIIKEVIKNEQ